MKHLTILCTSMLATVAFGAGHAGAAPLSIDKDGTRISALAPQPGDTGTLGFTFETDWFKGPVVLRCPETLSSSMGLHFIDHHRDDMPPLSQIATPAQWHSDPERGVLGYHLATPEGVSLDGTAELAADGAWITLRVHNGSKADLTQVNCQMCLDLAKARGFGQAQSLEGMFTWVDGQRFALTETTPTTEEKGRSPWVLLPTKGMRDIYSGPLDFQDSWWVVEQNADNPILAREQAGGPGIVGIAWQDPAAMLMSNTKIPCLHAGPNTPLALAPGESKSWHGKVYLTRNTPEQLRRQFEIDQAQGFLRHDLVVRREDAPGAERPGTGTIKAGAVRVIWTHGAEPASVIVDRGFRLAKDAVAKGAKFIVFPENFLHADDPREQMIPDGALVKRAEAFAREHSVHLCAGIVESWKFDWRDTYDTYLSAIVVGPDGYISRHRKVDVDMVAYNRGWAPGMPKTDMGAWAGSDFEMHQVGPIERLGIMICRDANSSWAWTRVLTQNPQIIASPNLRDSVTKYGADFGAMAARSGVPMIVASGHPQSESLIVNRRGEVVAFINDKEGAIVADVELAPQDPALVSFDVIHNTFVVLPKH